MKINKRVSNKRRRKRKKKEEQEEARSKRVVRPIRSKATGIAILSPSSLVVTRVPRLRSSSDPASETSARDLTNPPGFPYL